MKILVFGGNGMVGKSISKVLNGEKNLEIFSSTRADTDLFSYQDTFERIESFEPDIVINAAAKVGGIIANNTFRTEFIIENLKINMNIIESLKKFPKTNLINLGSSCIYPLNASIPISENSLMGGPLEPTNSPYAMAKLSAIEMGDALSKQYGNNVLNLMPTNLYGDYDNFSENSSHVIPGLIFRMHKAKTKNEVEFKVWGTGKPLREFLYVDDLTSAIHFLIHNGINDGIYNVGSNFEIAISDLVELIKSTIKFKGEIAFDTTKPDGNPRKLLDSSKIMNLGWSPAIEIETGLIKTYDWFLKNIT